MQSNLLDENIELFSHPDFEFVLVIVDFDIQMLLQTFSLQVKCMELRSNIFVP